MPESIPRGLFIAAAVCMFIPLAGYVSYLILFPIFFGRRNPNRRRGPWMLGRWSGAVSSIALGWIAVCLVLFVLPPNQLAGYTFAGCLVALALYWQLRMRSRFRGPPQIR